jgi:antitoxin StbD
MQDILAKKAIGLTDLREPRKVIEEANGEPVAIMNRNEVEGYFVPASAVNRLGVETIPHEKAMALFRSRKKQLAPGMEYLKDK